MVNGLMSQEAVIPSGSLVNSVYMLFSTHEPKELMTQIILLITILFFWTFSEARSSKYDPKLIIELKIASVTQCISELICLVHHNRPCVNVSALLVSTSLRLFSLKDSVFIIDQEKRSRID